MSCLFLSQTVRTDLDKHISNLYEKETILTEPEVKFLCEKVTKQLTNRNNININLTTIYC